MLAWNLALMLCHIRLVVEFWGKIRMLPNIAVPSTLAEKYLWRRVIERDPRFATVGDKLKCKQLMAEKFPAMNCAKVLWQGQDIRQAPIDLLRRPGYLKANHASGFNHQSDNSVPDLEQLHGMTQRWLRRKWYKVSGQWGYKDIYPQLFVEEDVGRDTEDFPLVDLNIYVFGEVITHIVAMTDITTDEIKFGRFDSSGNRMDLCEYPTSDMEQLALNSMSRDSRELPEDFRMPTGVESILQLACEIAEGFDHLRIDFMWNGDKYYFCEITVYPMAGFLLYSDQDLLARMADAWDLRRSWLLTHPQKGWRKHYASWLVRKLDASTANAERLN